MSVRVMTLIWAYYPNGGGELLTALAIADIANDEGDRIYPSVNLLAEKTRQARRTIQYQLRTMEESGWLELVSHEGGGRGQARHYRIPVERIPQGTEGRVQKLHPLERSATTVRAPVNSNGLEWATQPQETAQKLRPSKRAQTTATKGATENTKGATDDLKGATAIAPDPLEPLVPVSTATGAEPRGDSPPPAPPKPFLKIPLIKLDGHFTVTENMVTEWQESYPAIDVRQKIREIRQWNVDNPNNRKTSAGIRKHINGWLARDQNRAPKGVAPRPAPVDVICEHAEPGQPACGLPNARPSDRYGGKPVCAHHARKLIEATSSRRMPGHIRDALDGITKRDPYLDGITKRVTS